MMSASLLSVEPSRVAAPPRPEPGLSLETSVVTAPGGSRGRFRAFPFSLVLHGLVMLAVVLIPLFGMEQLPEPGQGIRAFLVEPPALAAPPPPPPPPAARAAAVRKTPPPADAASERFTAPVEVPDSIAEVEGLDLGVEGGVPGGVEGGVPGGVVGGVIGGLPEAPPPVAPVRVGSHIKEPIKIKHVNPVYPILASQTRLHGVVILECIVSAEGRVTKVDVLRGVPILSEAAVEAVKQWVYRPTLLNGVPTPVIMTVTVTFNLNTAKM